MFVLYKLDPAVCRGWFPIREFQHWDDVADYLEYNFQEIHDLEIKTFNHNELPGNASDCELIASCLEHKDSQEEIFCVYHESVYEDEDDYWGDDDGYWGSRSSYEESDDRLFRRIFSDEQRIMDYYCPYSWKYEDYYEKALVDQKNSWYIGALREHY